MAWRRERIQQISCLILSMILFLQLVSHSCFFHSHLTPGPHYLYIHTLTPHTPSCIHTSHVLSEPTPSHPHATPHLTLHLTHCLILNPHTATRRRSIRKVKPANKLDLIKKYKHSEEARLIKEQLDLVHSETGQRARRRCGNYISYHCKRIPYYITSFFLQVVCMRVCVSSRTKGLIGNRPY